MTRFQTGAKDQTADRLRAFEVMVARDWDRFWRYAYRMCGNADDAEDLLAESLGEAFQAFGQYRGQGFDKWIFRILTTNRIDMTRRAKLRQAKSLDTGWTDENGDGQTCDVVDHLANPEISLMDSTLSERMQKALDALPEEYRAAVLLCDVEQMPYSEIAEMLKLPIGTVRSRIHRGRTAMRKTLESLGWS
ncbi:RNA polymerase sigma factor SigE [Capsulimonas corticalis]|uniref:RNA polymerase sigma factor SigE n=1 Tax=Capsulimonas corticalis TaxID=2219043 RepID=A0A9N7KZ74_9BACT|nr:sigma-70 family RNA polymerase sigma factor [Capsulimonas corticalis]BDI28291.1 RNA polymerase sigma factor SigE [Capsulimonas corticalis]